MNNLWEAFKIGALFLVGVGGLSASLIWISEGWKIRIPDVVRNVFLGIGLVLVFIVISVVIGSVYLYK